MFYNSVPFGNASYTIQAFFLAHQITEFPCQCRVQQFIFVTAFTSMPSYEALSHL